MKILIVIIFLSVECVSKEKEC